MVFVNTKSWLHGIVMANTTKLKLTGLEEQTLLISSRKNYYEL